MRRARLPGGWRKAGLPCFAFAAHDVELDLLKVTWTHGVMLYMDLTREGFLEPIDTHGRAVILGLRRCCEECAELDVPAADSSEGLRTEIPIPGPWGRRWPPLHPDDGATIDEPGDPTHSEARPSTRSGIAEAFESAAVAMLAA